VIPFYYGFGTIINYGSGSDFLISYRMVPVLHGEKLRFLRFQFRFHNIASGNLMDPDTPFSMPKRKYLLKAIPVIYKFIKFINKKSLKILNIED